MRFYKSLQNLRITIDSTLVIISSSLDKRLVDNNYLPMHLELTNSDKKSFYNYLNRKLKKDLNLVKKKVI